MMISFLSFAARSSYSCHCYFSCNRRIMVVSQKAGYASCSKTFNWKHYGYGCSAGTTLHASSKILHNDSFFFQLLDGSITFISNAGHTGHIYSSFLCPSFSRSCSSSRSIDSFNIHDFAQSHCTTTFSITSEDITFCRENGLMILIPLTSYRASTLLGI